MPILVPDNTEQLLGGGNAYCETLDLGICFAAGTPVLLADGTTKPIEQIQPGDRVLSAPEHDAEGGVAARTVERVFHNPPSELIRLTIGGTELRSTPPHLFYVRDKGWTAAEDLQVGDQLRTPDARWITLDAKEAQPDPEPVFNFRVADYHTYFVGNPASGEAVLVHNEYEEEAGFPQLPEWTGSYSFSAEFIQLFSQDPEAVLSFMRRYGKAGVDRLQEVLEWGWLIRGRGQLSSTSIEDGILYYDTHHLLGGEIPADKRAIAIWSLINDESVKPPHFWNIELYDGRILQAGDIDTCASDGRSQIQQAVSVGGQVQSLLQDLRNQAIIEVASAGMGFVFSKVDDVYRLRMIERVSEAAPEGVVWASVGLADDVLKYAKNVIPEPGFTDVFVHATKNAFMIFHNGKWVSLNHRSMATFLIKNGVTGNIRLISCSAGQARLAQNLANKLNVKVLAATTKVGVPTNFVSKPLLMQGGKWIEFAPGR